MTTLIEKPYTTDLISLDEFRPNEFTLFFAGRPEALARFAPSLRGPPASGISSCRCRFATGTRGKPRWRRIRRCVSPPSRRASQPPPAGVTQMILDSKGKPEQPFWIGLHEAKVEETGGMRMATDDWPFLYTRRADRAGADAARHRPDAGPLRSALVRVRREQGAGFRKQHGAGVGHDGPQFLPGRGVHAGRDQGRGADGDPLRRHLDGEHGRVRGHPGDELVGQPLRGPGQSPAARTVLHWPLRGAGGGAACRRAPSWA